MLKNQKLVLLFIFTIFSLAKSQQCPFSQQLVNDASATYYTSMDAGNCGYETLTGPLGPGNYMIAALSPNLYQKGAGCGQCFNITSPYTNQSVVVMATDSCPDDGICTRDSHFDLSPQAFDILGARSKGQLFDLEYFRVPCQVNGNVKIMMKDGSNPYWTAFLIFSNKVIIKQVSVKVFGKNEYTGLTQTDYNYWVSPNMVPGAFEVRIESIGGEFIYITIPEVESRKIYTTNSQFTAEGCISTPNAGNPPGSSNSVSNSENGSNNGSNNNSNNSSNNSESKGSNNKDSSSSDDVLEEPSKGIKFNPSWILLSTILFLIILN